MSPDPFEAPTPASAEAREPVLADAAPAEEASEPVSIPSPAPAAVSLDEVDPSSFLFSSDAASSPLSIALQQSLADAMADAQSAPVSVDSTTATDEQSNAELPPLSPTATSPTSVPYGLDLSTPTASSSAYTLHSPTAVPASATLLSPAAAPPSLPAPAAPLHALPPSHPLLQSANAALLTALKAQFASLSATLSHAHGDLSLLEKQRTDLGVQLYAHQQDLAHTQLALERHVAGYHAATQAREAKEAEVDAFKARVAATKQTEADLSRQREALQRSVDELQLTIQRVRAYRAELDEEVRVHQAVTSNEERALSREEKAKNAQDLDLLSLSERLRGLQHEQRLLGLQADAQRAENNKLNATLGDLQAELRLVHVECKDFLERWRFTIRQNEVKAEAITMAEHAVDDLREQIRGLSLSVLHAQKSTRLYQTEHEQLVSFHQRLQNEADYLRGQIDVIHRLKAKYSENFEMIVRQCVEHEDTMKKINYSTMRLDNEMSTLSTQLNALYNKKQELEESKLNKVNEEITLEKNSEALWKSIRQNKSTLNGLDAQRIELQNDTARLQIDLINTKQHNSALKETKDNYLREISKKDDLIDQYESETAKRHELINKKQNDIIRLNHQLERLQQINLQTEYSETINYEGPLEIQITNLNKKIAALTREKEAAQKTWIKTQNELVHVTSEAEVNDGRIMDLDSQQSVFTQKNTRLSQESDAVAGTESALVTAMKQMRQHGAKMNEWIEEFTAKKEQLIHTNFLRQKDFLAQLKEKETETQNRANALTALRQQADQQRTLSLNTDYAIMQLQRKIQVEKETHALLDPTVGQAEIAALRKDNAQRELLIQGAEKQLERVKGELDRAIEQHVRERNIITPVNSKQTEIKQRSMLQQQIMVARTAVARKQKEKTKLREYITTLQQEAQLIQTELQRQQTVYNGLELTKMTADSTVDALALDVKMARERLILAQSKAKKIEERAKRSPRDESDSDRHRRRERLEGEREKGAERYGRLVEAVKSAAEEQPRYREFLGRLLQWA